MLQRFFRGLSALALALTVILGLGGQAQAQSLDDLRASGAVGERFDGFLVARDAGAQAFVKKVNAQRKKIYEDRAKAQGAPAAEVGKVYAKEIMTKAAPGTWLQAPDGSWKQK